MLRAYDALVAETRESYRLSHKLLPPVEQEELIKHVKDACDSTEHPVHSIVLTTEPENIVEEIANIQPHELFRSKLDGAAIACVVLAVLLFCRDDDAKAARTAAVACCQEELDLVCRSTDTQPVNDEADSIQKALMAFLRGDPMPDCLTQFSLAAYGRFGDILEVARDSHQFLKECRTLLEDSTEPTTREQATDTDDLFYSAASHPFTYVEPQLVTHTKPQPTNRAEELLRVAQKTPPPIDHSAPAATDVGPRLSAEIDSPAETLRRLPAPIVHIPKRTVGAYDYNDIMLMTALGLS